MYAGDVLLVTIAELQEIIPAATATELRPENRYLVTVPHAFSALDIHKTARTLQERGFRNIILARVGELDLYDLGGPANRASLTVTAGDVSKTVTAESETEPTATLLEKVRQ